MKPAFFLILVLLTGLSAAQPGSWRALLVGVDHYRHVAPLQNAEADVRLVARSLGPSEVLTSRGEAAGYASRPNLLCALDRLAGAREPVLVFFSGHALGEYLLLADSDPAHLPETAVSAGELRLRLARVPGSVTLLLDAWRNEPVSGKCCADNRLTAETARAFALDREDTTLFACRPGERSYEWHEQGNGFFAHFLARGLARGETDLAGYLGRELPPACRARMLQKQNPWRYP